MLPFLRPRLAHFISLRIRPCNWFSANDKILQDLNSLRLCFCFPVWPMERLSRKNGQRYFAIAVAEVLVRPRFQSSKRNGITLGRDSSPSNRVRAVSRSARDSAKESAGGPPPTTLPEKAALRARAVLFSFGCIMKWPPDAALSRKWCAPQKSVAGRRKRPYDAERLWILLQNGGEHAELRLPSTGSA